MNKLSIAAALVMCCFGFAPASAAEQERNAESFEKLRAECVKFAPPGWIVEQELVNDSNAARRGECPALVIRTEKNVALEYEAPNAPAGGETVKKSESLAIRLIAQPYISPIDYAALKRRNDDCLAQRLAMMKRLKGEKVNSAFMGPDPIPPSGFRPESYKETRLVWEYAFLWLETEPKPLPTHRFEILTLKFDAPQDSIRDQAVAEQYNTLLAAIKKTLTPYETATAKAGSQIEAAAK